MADLFENRRDLDPWRDRVWGLIEQTPSLDWLLVTKRIEHVADMIPWSDPWPDNVWIGATIENQAMAQRRLPHLLALPAHVRFVSAEPLLGSLDLEEWLHGVGWVIAGGESGFGARPIDPAWALGLRDQCCRSGIPFFFKQWGGPHRKDAGRLLQGSLWDQTPRQISATK